jgi:hypothetical protein
MPDESLEKKGVFDGWDNHNSRLLQQLLTGQDILLTEMRHIMAAIDDLKAAVASQGTIITDLATAVAAESADIDAAIAVITNPSSTDADVEAAAQAITSSNTSLAAAAQAAKDAAAKIKVAVPSAP